MMWGELFMWSGMREKFEWKEIMGVMGELGKLCRMWNEMCFVCREMEKIWLVVES